MNEEEELEEGLDGESAIADDDLLEAFEDPAELEGLDEDELDPEDLTDDDEDDGFGFGKTDE